MIGGTRYSLFLEIFIQNRLSINCWRWYLHNSKNQSEVQNTKVNPLHRQILNLVFWYFSSFVLPNQNEISFPNGRVNLLLNTPCWKTNDVLFFYNRYPCLQANRIKHDPSCCDDPEKLRTFLRQKNHLTTTIWHIFCFALLMKKIENTLQNPW